MDPLTVHREMVTWVIDDRIRFLQEAWDRSVDQSAEPELTRSQRELLDERLARMAEAPDDHVTWAEMRRSIEHR